MSHHLSSTRAIAKYLAVVVILLTVLITAQAATLTVTNTAVSGGGMCEATELGSAIEETLNAGGSSLTYDTTTARYSYTWKPTSPGRARVEYSSSDSPTAPITSRSSSSNKSFQQDTNILNYQCSKWGSGKSKSTKRGDSK